MITLKISTKGRYGLRAMVDLAVHGTSGHVSIKSIAERQNISENYLEQVFSTLRKAGLVKSIKGAQGGYALADLPEKITAGMILRVLEGDLSVIHENPDDLIPTTIESCLKSDVWQKIDDAINEVVDAITLEDLFNEHQKFNQNHALMFYI